MTSRNRQLGGLWWASPAGCLLLVVPVSLALAASTSDLSFRMLYRTPRSLGTDDVLLLSAAAGVLLLGVLSAMCLLARPWPRGWPDLGPAQLRVVRRAADVAFWLTVLGYVAFALAGAARGASLTALLGALASQENYSGDIKRSFAPVTGITTLTQMGIAYAVLGGLLLAAGHRQGVRRRLAVVVVLALLRTYFLTERLAVLEVAVPLLVLLAVAAQRRGSVLPGPAPFVAVPALVVIFGLFEYSRSWVFFRSRTTSSYSEFVLDRLAGYYGTAYNNGAVLLEHGDYPGRLPYGSLQAVWDAPGAGALDLYGRLGGGDAAAVSAQALERYANPEFNSPCGLCTPLLDFGTTGGMVFWLLAGVALGALYAGFRSGHAAGLLLYPVAFLGILEIPRYLFWTHGRIVGPVLLLVVTAVYLQRAGSDPGAEEQPRQVLVTVNSTS